MKTNILPIRFAMLALSIAGLVFANSARAQVLKPIDDGSAKSREKLISLIYESTKTAKTAKNFSTIIGNCDKQLAFELTETNTQNVSALKSWALCRRGLLRIDLIDSIAGTGNQEQAKIVADQAMSDFDTSIELDPKRYRAHLGRGIVFAKQANTNEAVKAFAKVLKLKSACHQALFNLAELNLADKNYEAATKYYSKLIETRPSDAEAYSGRGHCYFSLAKYKDALSDYQKTARLAPFDDLAKCHVGDAEQMLGNWARAHTAYSIASRNGQFTPALFRIARMLASCSDSEFCRPKEALEAINKAIELDGKTAKSLRVLAVVQTANGDFVSATKTRADAAQLEAASHGTERVAEVLDDTTIDR